MATAAPNHDPAEIARFDHIAQQWWDEKGPYEPLHLMNPVRAQYIEQHAGLKAKQVLDVGCGGGLLCEAMTSKGATVTGLDLGETTLSVAKLHALEAQRSIRYLLESVEQHADSQGAAYEVITCLEMLEHVPDPGSIIASITRLLKPGGRAVFSTLNRNPKSYALAIVGAEYILKLLPKGTHTYDKFIKPAELASWVRAAGLEVEDVTGLEFHPITRRCTLGKNTDVNYLMCARKPEQA